MTHSRALEQAEFGYRAIRIPIPGHSEAVAEALSSPDPSTGPFNSGFLDKDRGPSIME
jgi:hypothetical protein